MLNISTRHIVMKMIEHNMMDNMNYDVNLAQSSKAK